MLKSNQKKILYSSLALSYLVLVGWFILFTVVNSELWDFNVFYSSAKVALQGENIYRVYGDENFPYWYFPWVAWFFIPFAIFPFEIAKMLYVFLNLLSAYYIVYTIGRMFNKKFLFADQIFALSMSLVMCWLLFRVGQSDFILAAAAVLVMIGIDRDQGAKAALLFPLLLYKPHLLMIFLPFLLLRGGKKFLFSAIFSTMLLSFLAFMLIPNWPVEILRMLGESGQRTDNSIWYFVTMAELIGFQENWSGTANLPITVSLIIISSFVVWKNRHLDTIPLLTLALSASMLAAPRAYSYNLPFLIPALLWLSSGSSKRNFLVWLTVGIISIWSGFSTGSYWIVILTFILSALKAWQLRPKSIGNEPHDEKIFE